MALLVEAEGRRLFYTGDLRAHGRKARTFTHILERPPRRIDALLMEGSRIGRGAEEYAYPSEEAVEQGIAALIRDKPNAALLFCSTQNLDRIVTGYKAARQTGRRFVIDLYCAYMLHKLRGLSKLLPQYDAEGVGAKFWPKQMEKLRQAAPGFYDSVMFSGHGGQARRDSVSPGRVPALRPFKSGPHAASARVLDAGRPGTDLVDVEWIPGRRPPHRAVLR